MTKFLSTRDVIVFALLCSALALVAACSESRKASNSERPNNSNELPTNMGYCRDTCTKDCTKDSDCMMSEGELCCDLGSAGKTCLSARDCPRFCKNDSDCDSSSGEACLEVSITMDDKICVEPRDGIHSCDSDADCERNEVCCDIYDKTVCLPSGLCPASCSADSDCDTDNGEICCTTVRLREPNLKVKGLCLNPDFETCPTECSESSDCSTSSGELCCNGICQDYCPKICEQSSECRNQICCKSALVRLPAETELFTAGPRCEGTPYDTCSASDCVSVLGCTQSGSGKCMDDIVRTCPSLFSESQCSRVPGCTFEGSGSCSGSLFTTTCSMMESMGQSLCEMIAGCNYTEGEVCKTVTSPEVCSDKNSSDECETLLGCNWDSSGGVCSGMPTDCSSIISESECNSSSNCDWSASGGCYGTPLECPEITSSSDCNLTVFCSWTSSGSCTGTPIPCSSFVDPTECNSSDNCYWNGSISCTGAPTPCEELSVQQCDEQRGCRLSSGW